MKRVSLFFVIAFTLIGVVFLLETKGIITWRLNLPTAAKDIIESTTLSELQLIMLDIGQGDAELLKFPDGQTMLIDCGKDASILSALGRNLPWSKRDLDYLIITHPHADHFGGCLDVLTRFKVHKVYLNGYLGEHSQLLGSFFETLKNEEQIDGAKTLILKTPQTLAVGSTTLQFIYPDHELARDPRIPGATENNLDANNTSVVIKVSYGSQDILFTGDMEKPLENYLLKKNPLLLESEILKVGHHGSDSSSGEEFVSSVKPKFCLISSGSSNSYGHPHGETVRRLERANCQVLRTDQRGDILLALTTSTSIIVK